MSHYTSLANNKNFQDHLDSLDETKSTSNLLDQIKLTNEYLRKLGPEIQIVFKLCRDSYHKRFSELETIVTAAFDFARVAKVLGNNLEVT